MNRTIRALALVLAAALGPFAASAQPIQIERVLPAQPFALHSAGLCLEVNAPQLRVEGARVQLGRCDGEPHQAWRHERGRLVSMANGRCLELHEPDVGFNGARVQTVRCDGGRNQGWRFERGQVVSLADGRCLDAFGTEAERGPAHVQTWDCDSRRVERWAVATLGAPAPVRDVEAGPIFHNDQAAERCPRVCAPDRWTGVWRTTVPGRMSVCACEDDAPPWRRGREPVRDIAVGPQPMDERSFSELIRAMEGEAFSQGRLRVLESAAGGRHFAMAQLRRIVQLFSFPFDRVRAVEIVAPQVLDRGELFTLYGALEFDTEKAQVRQIFERLPK
jgi:Ricin-type beta-trefoil lectin domain/Domain of unknown function (DUF4476)/Mannan-binding protein